MYASGMIPTLVFDIETIPDADGIRKLYDTPSEMSDEDVVNIALHQNRQKNGTDFLPLHLHKICTISCAMRERDAFRIWTLGTADSTEAEVIQRFFEDIDYYTPQIVSWNGRGFDLPVLNYRGLIHGVDASRFWDMGEDDKDFKWSNYISRYHLRHIDLMDVMAMYNPRANAPLDDLAKLCGFPGKLGMESNEIWDAYRTGGIEEIRDVSEVKVANTHLVFLRFQLMRGQLTEAAYAQDVALVRETIEGYEGKHWEAYLAAWQ